MISKVLGLARFESVCGYALINQIFDKIISKRSTADLLFKLNGSRTLRIVLLFSGFGHKAQWGGDRRKGLLRTGSWLVDKLANEMLYHLLQSECMNDQVLSLWIEVRTYENSLLRNSFNVIVYAITMKMRKSVNENKT